MISRSLTRLGCEVFVCSTGAGALEYLEQRSFAVVLLDIRMPGMNGVELSLIIRQRWPDLPRGWAS